jgi:chromosome segregation ATPase
MSFYSTKTRLEELEKELKARQTLISKNDVLNQKVFDKIDSLDGHLQNVFEESRSQAAKLDELSENIECIKRDIVTIPKDTELKINKSNQCIKEQMAEQYATRKELNEGLNSIRNQARLIWSVIVAVGAAIGWFFDKLR